MADIMTSKSYKGIGKMPRKTLKINHTAEEARLFQIFKEELEAHIKAHYTSDRQFIFPDSSQLPPLDILPMTGDERQSDHCNKHLEEWQYALEVQQHKRLEHDPKILGNPEYYWIRHPDDLKGERFNLDKADFVLQYCELQGITKPEDISYLLTWTVMPQPIKLFIPQKPTDCTHMTDYDNRKNCSLLLQPLNRPLPYFIIGNVNIAGAFPNTSTLTKENVLAYRPIDEITAVYDILTDPDPDSASVPTNGLATFARHDIKGITIHWTPMDEDIAGGGDIPNPPAELPEHLIEEAQNLATELGFDPMTMDYYIIMGNCIDNAGGYLLDAKLIKIDLEPIKEAAYVAKPESGGAAKPVGYRMRLQAPPAPLQPSKPHLTETIFNEDDPTSLSSSIDPQG
jgi:hypothetical protein